MISLDHAESLAALKLLGYGISAMKQDGRLSQAIVDADGVSRAYSMRVRYKVGFFSDLRLDAWTTASVETWENYVRSKAVELIVSSERSLNYRRHVVDRTIGEVIDQNRSLLLALANDD